MPVYKNNAMNRKMGRVGKELNRVVFKRAKTNMKCKAKCEKSCKATGPKATRSPAKKMKNIIMVAGNPIYRNPRMAALKR